MTTRPILAIIALSLLASCGTSGGGDAGDDPYPAASTVVTYRFFDSSVPPEYHRSYSITIDAGATEIVVDSYGDEIGRDAVDTDADEFGHFLRELRDAIGERPATTDFEQDGCAGSTSESLHVTVDDETVFERYDGGCERSDDDAIRVVLDLMGPLTATLDPDT